MARDADVGGTWGGPAHLPTQMHFAAANLSAKLDMRRWWREISFSMQKCRGCHLLFPVQLTADTWGCIRISGQIAEARGCLLEADKTHTGTCGKCQRCWVFEKGHFGFLFRTRHSNMFQQYDTPSRPQQPPAAPQLVPVPVLPTGKISEQSLILREMSF